MKKSLLLFIPILLTSCTSSRLFFGDYYKEKYRNEYSFKDMRNILYSPNQLSSYVGEVHDESLRAYLDKKFNKLTSSLKERSDSNSSEPNNGRNYSYLSCEINDTDNIIFEFSNFNLISRIYKNGEQVKLFFTVITAGWKNEVIETLNNSLSPKPY